MAKEEKEKNALEKPKEKQQDPAKKTKEPAKKKPNSKRAKHTGKPSLEWVEYSKEEAIEIVKKLANEGHSKSEIGMILRDQYGIPKFSALTGMKISQALREANIKEEIPEDLLNLIKKSVKIKEHLAKNQKDFTCKRGYELTLSKIRRLVSYYKSEGILPPEWRFTDETAKLLVK